MVAGILTLAFTNTGLFVDEKIVLASMVVLMCVGVPVRSFIFKT